MLSATDYTLMDLGQLLALGAAVLCAPAAVVTAGLTVYRGRKRPIRKRSTALLALAVAAAVGGGTALGLFILKGTPEDASVLVLIVPAGAVIALIGALPAGLLARWLHRKVSGGAGRTSSADSEAV